MREHLSICMSLEFRGADGTRDINLDIVNMLRVFKAVGMYEITHPVCECADRKGGRVKP